MIYRKLRRHPANECEVNGQVPPKPKQSQRRAPASVRRRCKCRWRLTYVRTLPCKRDSHLFWRSFGFASGWHTEDEFFTCYEDSSLRSEWHILSFPNASPKGEGLRHIVVVILSDSEGSTLHRRYFAIAGGSLRMTYWLYQPHLNPPYKPNFEVNYKNFHKYHPSTLTHS